MKNEWVQYLLYPSCFNTFLSLTAHRRRVDEQYIESTDVARSKTFDQSEIEAIPVENGGKQESKWEAILRAFPTF